MERFENMQRFVIFEDSEIDWYKEYHVKALNLNSLVFENCSDFCADDKSIIVLSKDFVYVNWNDVDEFQVSDIVEKLKYEGMNVIYALYSEENNYLVGFVYEDK